MGFEVGSVLVIWVIEGWWSLVLHSVCIDHLHIDVLVDDVPEGCEAEDDPHPQQAALPEMLRFEGFRLEVQVLALVIPLVSDVVPEHLSGYFDGVGLRNAQSAPRSHEVSAEILGVVVVGERGFWLGQLGLEGKCVGKGILHAECPWILLEIRVERVVIAPIVGLCVVASTEGSL